MALKVGELYASFGIDSSDLGKALSGIEKQCEQAAKRLATTGAGLTLAVTTPLIKIGKDILQSSIDFESAFAGVKKTVDSGALKDAGMSYGSLSDALKRMTLEAPQTADALAGIMEAGGQLGIDVTALEGFTKTIAAMGVATNMTTDEASAMFAKFANITGMSQAEFENLGSTIVKLGNNFATTENDIMTMAMRMASAGTTIGMSETDILAFATAMSSVGIMAEVGGSSFSTFASNLSLEVATTGDKLKTYAAVAGMTGDQFKQAFKDDAASAINSFIQGLNDVDRNGMSAIQILDKLGIKEVGMRNMLLSLANSGTLLGEALDMSAGAWKENIALMEEANQRYGTTESQIQIMKNALELIKIDLGDLAMPNMKDLTGHVIDATKAFLGMDEATKVSWLKMGGLAAATGPALTALGGLVGVAGKLAPMLGTLISPIGVLGAGLALFSIAAVDANNDIGKSLEAVSLKAKKSLTTGNASLAGTMKKISSRIPAIAGSIVKVVGNTVPGILELGFTAITGFADSISANANVISEVGMSIVKNISSGLAKGLPQLIPAATSMLLNIGSALISNIPALLDSAIEVGAAIWSGVKSGIVVAGDWLKQIVLGEAYTPDADWSTVGAAIWPAITNGITAAGDWVKQKVLGESYTADASWSTVGSAIWTQIQTGITATGDWIKALILGNAFTADSDWSDVGEKIASMISGGLAKLDFSSDEMTANVSSIGNFMQTFVQKMLETPINATASIATFISSIVSGIAAYDGWSSLATTFGTIATSVIDGIVTAVPTIATGATTFINAIGSMISSVSQSDLLPACTHVATEVINSIADGIPTVASGASSIISALGNMLSSIDWGNVAAEVLNSATAIGKALINAIVVGISNLGDLSVNIIGAVGNILSSINWENVTVSLEGFGQMLTTGLVKGISALGTAGAKIVEAVGNLFVDLDWTALADTTARLGNVLIDGIIKGIGALANAGAQIVTALTTVISNVNWKEVGTATVDLAGKLFDGLLTGAAEITPDVSALMSALGRGIAAAGAGLGEAAGSLIANLVTAICSPENWTALVATGGEIVRGLGEGIINLGAGIIEGAWNLLAGTVKTLLEDLGLIAKENPITIHYTEDGKPKTGGGFRFGDPQETTTAAQETVTAAEVALQTLPDTAVLLGGDAATGLATGIKNNGSTATAAMNTLSDDVVKAALKEMSYDTGYQTGFDYAGAMNAGIIAQQGPVAASAGVVALGAKNMAASTISYFVGSGIGYQFSSGIAGGIRSGISLISSAAVAAANAAVLASQSTLEIHSPSRRGEKEVGWLYDEGIAKGILGNYDVISRAASDVTESMHRSFYVGDPSHGTVYTARRSASQSAIETEAAINDPRSIVERSKMVAAAIASELMNADEKRQITVVMTLDGRVVAKGLAPYANEELAVTPEWT